MAALSDEELQKLFAWVDTIPLSRPKRNINRDFSDGVLAAEVVAHYFPRLVDLHNYSASSNSSLKLANWTALNAKVLKKLKHSLAPPMLEDLVHAKPGAAEVFLHTLQYKLAKYKADRGAGAGKGMDDARPHRPSHSPSSPSHSPPVRRGTTSTHAAPRASASSPVPSLFSVASHGPLSPGVDLLRQQQPGGYGAAAVQREVDEEILIEKEETIQELRETVDILEMKTAKLEQLLRLKDVKIQHLSSEVARLSVAGMGLGEGGGEGRSTLLRESEDSPPPAHPHAHAHRF